MRYATNTAQAYQRNANGTNLQREPVESGDADVEIEWDLTIGHSGAFCGGFPSFSPPTESDERLSPLAATIGSAVRLFPSNCCLFAFSDEKMKFTTTALAVVTALAAPLLASGEFFFFPRRY